MANYIGNQIQRGEFKKLDNVSSLFDGSTTTFNLTFNSTPVQVGDTTALIVSLNGVIQEPVTSYTLANGGSQIVFSTAPSNGASCFITQLGGIGDTTTPSDGSVTASKIVDGTISSAKLDSSLSSSISEISSKAPINNPVFTGSYVKVPEGTTAQRPWPDGTTSGVIYGGIRFNSDKGVIEQYVADNYWAAVAPSASITSVTLPGSQTAVYDGDTITVNGIGFDTGSVVSYIDSSNNETEAPTTSRIDTTQLTAVIPNGLSEGTYSVKVTSGTGVSTVLGTAFDVDGVAVFNSASGSLGTFDDYTTISTLDAGATEDGSAVSVSITSGSLPTGLSMNGAGSITGTLNAGISLDTTYSFTVTATDAENQTSTRSFSITVNAVYEQAGSAFFG
jgi:hypothetical protein